MKDRNPRHNLKQAGGQREQAVVIGGSVAGLVAAQVLARSFARVTVVDRDGKAGGTEFRSGAPQANHAHTLLPFGLRILERQFPGLSAELEAAGAVVFDEEGDTLRPDGNQASHREHRQPNFQIAASRPLLESILYRRVSGLANVRLLAGMDATGVQVDQSGKRVTGLRLRSRASHQEEILPADLLVDASGRASRAPQWLESLGFLPPEEWHIDAHAGYASRIYRQPADFDGSWKRMYISPVPSSGTRGGIVLPLEGDRWHVTLIGMDRDYPPSDEAGFMAFAASLPVPDLFMAIQKAEPLTHTSGFRQTDNRVRRYDKLPAYLEGFLVTGDAVFTMNPVYALGMTAAAAGARSLALSLQHWKDHTTLDGLAAHFQKRLADDLLALWRQAVENEWRWGSTEITDNSEEIMARMSQPTGV